MSKQQSERPAGLESARAERDADGAPAGIKGGRAPIPVKRMGLALNYDGPGIQTSSLTDRTANAGSRHTLEYLPWMRHFRVVYHEAKRDMVWMIHETFVTGWEPAEAL